MVQAQTKLELGLSFASILFLLFLRVGGWVLKLKLMLTQSPTGLELELGLSLATGLNWNIGTIFDYLVFAKKVLRG